MNSSKISGGGLYAYPDVGRTGLCNMLFPWARAVLYARKKNCRILAPRWTKMLRVGPWLRGERDKRYYNGLFTNDGYVKGVGRAYAFIRALGQRYDERSPAIYDLKKGLVVFRGLGNYFMDFPDDAAFLREELLKIVSKRIVSKLGELPREFIGVHVRCGDFVSTGQSMSNEYYLKGIEIAKSIVGMQRPVLVFSDAKGDELSYLSDCPGVRFMPAAPAIHDVLALSRASILVGTNHSSFSEWAVFLGGMKSVWSREGRRPCELFDSVFV